MSNYKGNKPNRESRSGLEFACMEMEKYKDHRHGLRSGFLRPIYQGTRIENDYVTKLHENDYLK